MYRQRGFTLIELMIVVAIIAIIASIAIPNLMAARIRANESAAIATLKTIASVQAQCQASGQIDVNSNGKGEYGFLAEMGALAKIRTAGGAPGTSFVQPRLMTVPGGDNIMLQGSAFPPGGAMKRSGYYFMMFLPSSTAGFVPESSNGGASATNNPDPALSESLWCVYAWPVSAGRSGNRVFIITNAGDILSANNTGFTPMSGSAKGPNPFAAFVPDGMGTARMTSSLAVNRTGADGERWTVVN